MKRDFSTGLRGAVVTPEAGKQRITIRLDCRIIEHFKRCVHEAGGGNYQSLINEALKAHIDGADQALEKRLRRIIREEMRAAR